MAPSFPIGVFQTKAEIPDLPLRELQPFRQNVPAYTDASHGFMPAGCLSLDRGGRIRAVNLIGAALLGSEPVHVVNTSLFALLSPNQQRRLNEHLRAVFSSRAQAVTELRIKDPLGKFLDLRLESIAMPDSEGNGQYCRTVMLDVSEYKERERRLLEEKNRVHATLQSIGEAVITTNAAGIVEYLNPVAEALTGWSLAAVRGRAIETVLHMLDEDSREPYPNPVTECLVTGSLIKLPDHIVLVSRSDQEYAVEGSVAPIRNRNGKVVSLVLAFHDVTEARRNTRRLAYQATHDALTGLVNRHEFERRLQHALASVQHRGAQHVLCYLDLDFFKSVNDCAGHSAGDELLRQLTAQLTGQLRTRDTLARIGGDEFGLLLENCALDSGVEIAETLVRSVRDFRFIWQELSFQVGISIGLVPITTRIDDISLLIKQADLACYIAKQQGRNRIYIYSTENKKAIGHAIEAANPSVLEAALEKDRFLLYHQPIFSLGSGKDRPVFYEILLRLRDPRGSIVPFSDLLAAAERGGLMNAIDRWVISRVLEHPRGVFCGGPEQGITINLSESSLKDRTFAGFIDQQFAACGVPPQKICFEIAATHVIGNLSPATQFMGTLKKIGCRLALTHLGSDPIPVNELSRLPVDYLKIDGKLVLNIADNPINQAIVETLSQISRFLGTQTIAEYIEHPALIEPLRQLGMEYGQGHALGLPQPLQP